MSTQRQEVEIVIEATDRTRRGMRQAEGRFQRFTRTVNQHKAAILGVTGAAVGAGFAIKGLADAALEQQKAERTLAQIVENTGASYADMEERVLATTAALQRKTNFGDEEQIRVLARLTSVIGDSERALQALPTILDAAAISGSGLREISGTLGRALAGTVNTAEALGITFDETATFAERLATAQRVAGGAAEAQADPFTQFGNAVGDLQEAIGEVMLPALSDAAEGLTTFVNDLNDSVTAVQDLGGAIGKALGDINEGPESSAIPDFSEEVKLLTDALFRAQNPGLMLAETVEDLGNETERTAQAMDRATEAGTGLAAGIEEAGTGLVAFGSRTQTVNKTLETTFDLMTDLDLRNQSLFESTGKFAQGQEHLNEIAENANRIWEEQDELLERVNGLFNGQVERIENVRDELAQYARNMDMANGFIRAITSSSITLEQALDLLEQKKRQLNSTVEDSADNLEREANAANSARQALLELAGARGGGGGPNAPSPTITRPEAVAETFQGLVSNIQRALNQPGRRGLPANILEIVNLDFFRNLVDQFHQQGHSTPTIAALREISRMFGGVFHQGGVVPGPRGADRMIMAQGGERVVPPGKAGASVNVNVDMRGAILTSAGMEQEVARAWQRVAQKGGFDGMIQFLQ